MPVLCHFVSREKWFPPFPLTWRLSSDAHLAAGWRRACQTTLAGPCAVHIPPKTAGGRLAYGQEGGVGTVPIVKPVLSPAEPKELASEGK